jgi:2-polyprenyl-3-methyl-5-hydroxy-6-metoxy-1,4-benzoquinol methylase
VKDRSFEALSAVTADEREAGLRVARDLNVGVFVVAFNAESHIEATLKRIPGELHSLLSNIYVIDDKSSDRTTEIARQLRESMPKLEVFTTPYNQGYGGNQKLGYQYAIQNGIDVVVLLHGDGQYAPEVLARMIAPFEDPDVSAVFGSRMMTQGAARRGGMPLYKYVGNRILTFFENGLLGTDLSEFHSGYRAYRTSALAGLPFQYNTNDFHFDTEIIIQLAAKNERIVEVPIPTYYGDELCHVDGVSYALNCMLTVLRSRANRVYLVHHPKFDLDDDDSYVFKEAPSSVHQYVLRRDWLPGTKVLELGAGHGLVSAALHELGTSTVAVDLKKPDSSFPFPFLELNLDGEFSSDILEVQPGGAECVVALDIIEHLHRPERTLRELKRAMTPGGKLIASTGNIAYFLPRIMLFLGQFNYGKKGILDLTHQRLFTIRSFCRTLEGEGFNVEKVTGFGPPIEDMVGNSLPLRLLDRFGYFLGRIWPRLFSYQFVVEATGLDDVGDLLASTIETGKPDE